MNFRLEHVITWLILLSLSIGCAPTPRATLQPDRPTLTPTIDVGAPHGATPVKSPDGNATMTRLVVAPDGAVWFSFGSYDWSHPYGGGVSRYAQGQLTHFTSDDGLPGDNVQALRVAPEGPVWVGALCGIARYDGQTWHVINKANDCESVGGPVIDFAFTPDGSVWAGTAFNVAHFDGQQWTRYEHLFGWLTITSDGAVWATGADDDGLYLARFSGSDWIKFKQLHSGGIAFSYDASLWILEQQNDNGTSQLAHFDGQTWEIVPVPTLSLSDVAIAPDGTPWALTTQGVARFNGLQWLFEAGLTGDFTSMTFAPDGTLWLGGRGGQLLRYQPTTGQSIVVVTPLPTPTPFPPFTPDPNAPAQPVGPAPSPSVTPIPQLPVTNLVVTSDGAVWYSFGNFDFHPRRGGIVREAQGQQTRFMSEATVQLLKVAPDGSLWAGMGCGLLRFDGQAWQTVIENCDMLHGNIIDVAFTSDGAAWIATGFKLARYHHGDWTIIDRLINFVEITPDGTVWASGWEGRQGSQYVARFDGTQWTIVERAAVRQLLAAGDGSVWGTKADNSLVHYTGNISQTLTNLPFDQIDELVRGPNDDVWAITDRGVVRFDGAQWQLVSNLPDNITQMAFAPDGSLWVGNRAGAVSRVDPAASRFATLPPRPTIAPSVVDPSLPTPPPLPTNSDATQH
jgi:ligand-binding sensor domain-containing protein